MADIRINSLTTTASSTASDDFIAVDGTTNGTRKLNAFSPTFGGNATVTGTLTANGLLTAAATTSLDGLPTAAIFGATKRVVLGYNTSSDYGFIASADSGTTWKELRLNPSGGLVKVPSTSASTSTSSGALVVSGGVGVAGAMNVGGSMKLNYFSTAGDPTALGVVQLYATTNTTSGAGGIEWKADAGGNGYGYRTLTVFDGVSAYDLYTQVRSNSASWTNSLILKSNGNATFSGSVQTSAPSGGTAAAWKLGTVATVSPTSPNRTIEVDIGGTIYYIHAKTTNN